ncbi:MAG: T9SS type A sorting domain-containing protein [Ignavibacteriaceae bacterium]|nr:T9SS type A sorting domain-containing protein [Ignavibacteriaceae bacterium]
MMPALPNTDYRITAEVCYQSIKPGLADHLRGINELDINRFVGMYDNLSNVPFIMRGVTFDIVTDVENETVQPNRFFLEQNYPNPFNPATKIKFTIPTVIASGTKQSQLTSLKIYDVLGNEVATLVKKELSAGNYEVEFDAADFSSGIYYYQLKAGDFVDTKKMILLK